MIIEMLLDCRETPDHGVKQGLNQEGEAKLKLNYKQLFVINYCCIR